MRIPESARLIVLGFSPDTGELDLRRHFKRYGYVADIWLHYGRRYAFVQFMLPSHAGLALADKNQVVNGRKLYIRISEPTKSPQTSTNQMSKYPCQRVCVIDNCFARIGDTVLTTLGPLYGNYEKSEYINNLRRYGVMKDNMLIFNSIIDYISEDGQRFWVSLVPWPANKSDAETVISSTPFVGDTTAKFCRYCQRVVTPDGSSNCEDLVHTDSCLIYQESFVHFTYGVKIGKLWYPCGGFVGRMSNAEQLKKFHSQLENFQP